MVILHGICRLYSWLSSLSGVRTICGIISLFSSFHLFFLILILYFKIDFLPIRVGQPAKHVFMFAIFHFSFINIVNSHSWDLIKKTLLPLPRGLGRDRRMYALHWARISGSYYTPSKHPWNLRAHVQLSHLQTNQCDAVESCLLSMLYSSWWNQYRLSIFCWILRLAQG